MALTAKEIMSIGKRLTYASPHLSDEITALVAEALHRREVQWVEVTHYDGQTELMPAEEYSQRTAMDLAHRELKLVTEREARLRRGIEA